LPLRKEHRLRVFKNKALWSIFGSKKEEETKGWRKLHNEGLHSLNSSPSVIILMKSKTIEIGRKLWAG
jgi:hypothetical protein